ncbi:hypothetical protein P167DRAFT_534582 [Morchella conica CCBAS932]|uniref:Uncharacterized protein n=1 Tax=Morchella conica CCBAS932 TaxID=1392247 RepID=A0A3N4L7J1_9PEZI|nr:hypothetical protein P167DRAFT_534582 [Morchella conica CCBAS932]
MGKYIKHPLTKSSLLFFLSSPGANPYRPSRVFFHSIRTINRLPRSRAIASQNFANNILNSSKRYKFDSSLADIH